MSKITLLDGAMGTALASANRDPSCASSLKNPEIVEEITSEYIESGARIVETCTFSATSVKYGNFKEINRRAVEIAKKAVSKTSKKVRIAGSVGPVGKMVKPIGDMEFEDAVRAFSRQMEVLRSSGVDLFIIETMDDISQMRAALIAAKEIAPGLDVIATMTFSEDGRTSTGTPPEVAAVVMDRLGADVVGVNCSYGPEGLYGVVKAMREATSKPICVQANAGVPINENGKTVYPMTPQEYAVRCRELVRAGASYIGGCCGTTGEYIRFLREKIGDIKPPPPVKNTPFIITSRTDWIEFGNYPIIIGERINFLAHPEIKDSNELIVREAIKQRNAGAGALDVNLGRDEERTAEVIELLSSRVNLPLVLDSQNPEAVEAAARIYPGVLLLNSISAEKKKMKSLLPLAKKYGMPFIGLCVSDEGVPSESSGKIRVAEKILKRAEKEGIPSSDVVIDPVTFSISTDTSSAVKTLEALRRTDSRTVLGISNVSSGFPQKAVLNQTYSSLAVASGCSALIANPLDTDLIYSVRAAALLSGRDLNGDEYIKYFSPSKEAFKFENPLSQAVLEGGSSLAAQEAEKLLKTNEPLKIINEYIIPALDKVGGLYSERVLFLPQLIQSAKACENSMALLEKELQKRGGMRARGRVVIATVKGDIHDIGKNLVSLILKNHSYEVRDLGVDVDSETIVREARSFNADIVALSSLMTTTMDRMKEVSSIIREQGLNIPILVGGAAVTSKFAESIGARYAPDAVEAVRVAEKLTDS